MASRIALLGASLVALGMATAALVIVFFCVTKRKQ